MQVCTRHRRTQAERRNDMRRQLLDATVASMVELGYHGVTTLAVERRAKVSRGARVHHFATKAELMAAAANHLLDRIAARYGEAFGCGPDAPTERDRMQRGLGLLWSIHRRSEYVVLLELSMAARTDEELRGHLRGVGTHQRQLAAAAVVHYFPSLDSALAHTLVETVHATMLGLVVRRNVEPGFGDDGAVLAQLEALIAPHLANDDPSVCP